MAAVVEVALSPPRLTGPSRAASLVQKTPMPLWQIFTQASIGRYHMEQSK
jgi:hypothetical protein